VAAHPGKDLAMSDPRVADSERRAGWGAWLWRIGAHLLAFWIFLPTYGARVLPLGDLPLWHDDLARLAASPDAASWQAVNARFAKLGRFAPGVFALNAAALRLNDSPQIAYWLLAMLCVQATVAAVNLLVEGITGSAALAFASSSLLLLLPHLVSTATLSINAETIQLPFLTWFLYWAYRYCLVRPGMLRLGLALAAYFGVLVCKETGVLLAPGLVGVFLLSAALRHRTWKATGVLALGSVLVTLVWWAWRSHYLSAYLEGYPAQIVSLDPGSVARRLVIWLVEILAAFLPLAIVIAWFAWKTGAALARPARTSEADKETIARVGLIAIPLAAFVVGMASVTQVMIRYFTPAMAMAAVVMGAGMAAIPGRRTRVLAAILLAASVANAVAGGLTCRSVVTEVLRWQDAAVRQVAELPCHSRLYFDAPAPLDNAEYLPNITWSVHTFYGRGDLTFRAYDPQAISSDRGAYVLVMASRNVTLVTDRYIGDDALEFQPGARQPVWEYSHCVLGWQLRGIDLLLWARDALNPGGGPDRHPLGITRYEMESRVFQP